MVGDTMIERAQKPPFRLPTMIEAHAVPWNGLGVVSTFTGCGGSELGFRLAGFRTLMACEFIDEARRTFQANFPGVPVDGRDIRQVTAADVLERTGLKRGELDVLEGSPPCSSFSTAGKLEAGWGKVKAYSDKAQRTDDLFDEYIRLIDGLNPRAFVAENVSGMAKGTAKGFFIEVMRRTKALGYQVRAKVLDAQWLGVPQARQRIIFVGIRDDVGKQPEFPKPLLYRYTLGDVLAGVKSVVHDTRGLPQFSSGELIGRPSCTLTLNSSHHYRVTDAESISHPIEPRKFTIAELRRICSFPEDFQLTGTYAQQWERMGRAVPPLMMKAVALEVAKTLGSKPCAD